eukprot:CAMPEP_0170583258 /NCGR_PEP_ID=MMETSP0224-20130122/8031_1 /TAXON_ID=285029 /ORGANISM="Togula jolla, Strain CCCM 725" /LENGTH=543 /DNA_ID=CAMNT_0010906557 /DNA_START=156 /DNA_END=1787 /DNA_ORIENTATION=+
MMTFVGDESIVNFSTQGLSQDAIRFENPVHAESDCYSRQPNQDVQSDVSTYSSTISSSSTMYSTLREASRNNTQQTMNVRLAESVLALDRRVHVESILDFYDPGSKICRVLTVDNQVMHRRRATDKNSVRRSLGMVESSHSEEMSQTVSALSCSSGGWEWGCEHSCERLLSGPERVTAWTLFAGNLLRSSLINTGDVADRSQERHLQRAGKQARLLSSVRGRARNVLFQVGQLTQRLTTEHTDKLDSEWTEKGLLKCLFGKEYYDTLMLLATSSRRVLSTQPALASSSTPCRAFGNVHGQLRDLLLHFKAFGLPDSSGIITLIFTIDFIGGCHQLEVLGILLALKVLLPDKVWLIRGNDSTTNEGFKDVCVSQLGQRRGERFFNVAQHVFHHLPVAALVSDRVLVLHSIQNGAWSLSDLRKQELPLKSPWIHKGFEQESRGAELSLEKSFCARNGLSLIIQSQQFEDSRGFEIMHEHLLRIFSARDYEGNGNDGAVALIQSSTEEDDVVKVRLQVLGSVTKAREKVRARLLTAASSSKGVSLV